MNIEQKVVTFTIDQINELLVELGKIPFMHSAHLIAGIKQIAEPQLTATMPTETPVAEPDISLS